jgi:hypothetical protein
VVEQRNKDLKFKGSNLVNPAPEEVTKTKFLRLGPSEVARWLNNFSILRSRVQIQPPLMPEESSKSSHVGLWPADACSG